MIDFPDFDTRLKSEMNQEAEETGTLRMFTIINDNYGQTMPYFVLFNEMFKIYPTKTTYMVG